MLLLQLKFVLAVPKVTFGTHLIKVRELQIGKALHLVCNWSILWMASLQSCMLQMMSPPCSRQSLEGYQSLAAIVNSTMA